MLDINVFPIEQPGGTFYYGKFKAQDLLGKLSVIRRSTNADGVQRDLTGRRTREISDYLSTADAVLPTPLVISVESAELHTDDHGFHVMHIPTREDSPWGEIIDGQHRYEGLKSAAPFHQYEVPVCIFVKLMVEDKATVFGTINSNQVKVPKSYIYDLFDYTDKNTPTKFGHDVCKTLNYDQDGPLSRRIKMLGRKLNDTEVLSQGALVDAIVPLISKNEKQDDRRARDNQPIQPDPSLPLRQLYMEGNTIVFSKIVRNYLQALKGIAGENWEKYVLRSVGMKVFMRILGSVAKRGLDEGNLSRDFFHSYLSPIQADILACTTADGTNKRAEDATVERLTKALMGTNAAG
ncbi:DGQHR domain-containing protein [Paucibacter sp. PLA-PC-4]|uniref:DGQHR domain-containing protein n=1 Tax=Paucibacter sp. PLA-PC-4 TaxID=2993655 RepID=UPI00224B865B|nr:DGQHR domain-containing protein [Paucibacter sp. PLA-PC-4]MCX2864179.1 DGQHR domain-containing protein [Paucibacter sp. PLA-PC-4]